MTKKQTSILFSLLCCAPLSLQAMDTQQWLQDRKEEAERKRQEGLAVLPHKIERIVDAHKITDALPLACLKEYTRLRCESDLPTHPANPEENVRALQQVMEKIHAFIGSKELKELAGPVPHRIRYEPCKPKPYPSAPDVSNPPDLEHFAWYLQECSPAKEMPQIGQLPAHDPLIRALKLGSCIIRIRQHQGVTYGIDPTKPHLALTSRHFLDLIDKAYAHLETPL
jgi:hypothetical protein